MGGENKDTNSNNSFNYLRICYCLSYLLVKRTPVTSLDDFVYYDTYTYVYNEEFVNFVTDKFQYLISLVLQKVSNQH